MCSTYIYENRCLPNIRGKYQAVNLITIAYHVIMANHYGQIVEKVIRRDGHSISDVSRLMKVNRRSVYNWFNQPNLRPEIIYRIGRIIKHDFSVDLPHVFKSEDFAFENKKYHHPESFQAEPALKDGDYWKKKYTELLKSYKLLAKDKVDIAI